MAIEIGTAGVGLETMETHMKDFVTDMEAHFEGKEG